MRFPSISPGTTLNTAVMLAISVSSSLAAADNPPAAAREVPPAPPGITRPTTPPPGSKPAPGRPTPPRIPLRERAGESVLDAPGSIGLRPIAPGVFMLGQVRLDQNTHEVSLPVAINMKEGQLEYALVTTKGKTHESVLRTDAEPYHIHTSMLLLGASGTATNALFPKAGTNNTASSRRPAAAKDGPQPLSNPGKEASPGDPISLELAWDVAGKEVRRPLGDLILNAGSKQPLGKGAWAYNGSRFGGGRFLAQLEGSVVSLVTDPDALANSNASGHDDDKIWIVNTNGLPPADARLELVIRIERTANGAKPVDSAPTTNPSAR